MSASFVVTLDTTAPSVAWGDPSGANASELLAVPYTLTNGEPVTRAVLVDAGGVPRELTVYPDRFELLLPPDTYDGRARVDATDDVGNAASLTFRIRSPVAPLPPTPPPRPSPPSPPSRPPRRPMRAPVITRRGSAGLRLRSSARSGGSRGAAAGVRLGTRASARGRTVASTQLSARSRAAVRSRLETRRPVRTFRTTATVARREGPSTEDALLLELL